MVWVIAYVTLKMFNLSLSARIRLALVAVSVFSSLVFAIMTHQVVEHFEQTTLKIHLRHDLERFIFQYKDTKEIVNVRLSDLHYLKFPVTQKAKIPKKFRGLGTGEHEIEMDYGEDIVFVVEDESFIQIMLSEQERFEGYEELVNKVVMVISVFIVLFSLLVSYWLSGHILKPIKRLTDYLANDESHQLLDKPIDLDLQKDEVGYLAKNFNQYIYKITQLLHREQLFTADISHELRTPLMIIKSATELLQLQPKSGQQGEAQLKQIEVSVNEMQDLLDTFLSLARDKNKHQHNAISDSVESILEKRLEYWLPYASGLNVKIHSHVEAGVVTQFSIPLFSTVLNNLIKNALHHSHSEAVDIYLNNDRLMVCDHGPELSDEFQRVLFNAYEKGDPTSEGLGMGLSIVKRICEYQGWQVKYQYHDEQGSCFKIEFNS